MIDPITRHMEAAKDRLLQQYKESPKLKALIDALFGEVQTFETIAHQLYSRLKIDSSAGQQLDRIGTIIGQDRMGFDDVMYRILLKVRIGKNISRGTIEEVIHVWKLITQADVVNLVELYPAVIALYSNKPIAQDLTQFTYALMQETVAAGVRVDFLGIIFDPVNAFGFDPDDPNVNGFGDATDPLAGGKFAYIQLTRSFL